MDDKGLVQFCHEIAGAVPISVPLAIEPWARPDFCFINVRQMIEKNQGSMQLGWLFVHGPVAGTSGFLVAIHHAVWRSPDGNLLEITPTPLALTDQGNLLFLPDDQATLEKPPGYEVGIARPCHFFPLSNSKKVLEKVRLGRRMEWQSWSSVVGKQEKVARQVSGSPKSHRRRA